MKYSLSFSLSLVFLVSMATAQQEPLQLFQGWEPENRFRAYSISEGSELMPLSWFLNLKVPNTDTLLKDEVYKFGLINGGQIYQNSKFNPYKLPVGFTVSSNKKTDHLYKEKKWVGVNCTACHTGILKINNQRVIVDGGASVFDIQKFEKSILNSVNALLEDDTEQSLAGFFKSIKNTTNHKNKSSLKKYLELFSKEFGSWHKRGHIYYDKDGAEVPYGPGRIDGLGSPTNDLLCKLTDRIGSESDQALQREVEIEENCKTSQPPSSLPHLWGMGRQDSVQWFGNAPQHAAITRDIGQATGTYGKNWVVKGLSGKPKYESTADPKGLYELEALYDLLRPPHWQDLAFFGVVEPMKNTDLLKQGRKIYMNRCNSCHAVTPNQTNDGFWKTFVDEGNSAKTDDTMLTSNFTRKSLVPNKLAKRFKSLKKDNSLEVYASEHRTSVLVEIVKGKVLSEFGLWALDLVFTKLTQTIPLPKYQGYKARSLEGVIFTAPYLHNGSVPTIYDLLLPENERPKAFNIGCENYDVKKFGYACDDSFFSFDIKQEGNSNKGHEYGTDLNDSDRYAVIEFLKYLDHPVDGKTKDEREQLELKRWNETIK